MEEKTKMEEEETKWGVVLWEYGNHCDEFEVNEVIGPYTLEEAMLFKSDEYHVSIAIWREREKET